MLNKRRKQTLNQIVNKFKTASPAAKASMALLFANLVLKGLSLISGPVFTRLMSTEQYGIVSTFTSWQSMLSVIITLNLSQGVFNNGMLDFKDNRDEFELSLLTISSLLTVAFFAIFSAFKQHFTDALEIPSILIYVMILYFLVVPAYQFWSGRQRYEFKYKALTILTIGSAVISLIVGIIAVVSVKESKTAIARVCVMEGTNIVLGLFFYIYLIIKAKCRIKLSYCMYALKFNLPLLPHYLSMYVLSSSDRIMIAKMINTSATAIYSVAYTVASVINIVWQSIEASLSPWIYEKLSRNDKESVRKVTFDIVLLFAALCLVSTLFAPEIMLILAPKSYSEGVYVIPPVAAGVFFTALYSLYMRIELYYKKTGFAAIATCIAAAANILLNYIFIRRFGFIAAGYTTMACYILLSLFHYYNVKKKGYADILNNRGMFLISILLIVATLIISGLYSHMIIRYSMIVVMLAIAVIKRKQIISLIKIK